MLMPLGLSFISRAGQLSWVPLTLPLLEDPKVRTGRRQHSATKPTPKFIPFLIPYRSDRKTREDQNKSQQKLLWIPLFRLAKQRLRRTWAHGGLQNSTPHLAPASSGYDQRLRLRLPRARVDKGFGGGTKRVRTKFSGFHTFLPEHS